MVRCGHTDQIHDVRPSSREGCSGAALRLAASGCIQGRVELIASPALLNEPRDVLARPRFRRWVTS